MNRKRVILAALLGVLSISLLYAYLSTPRLEKAPPRAADPVAGKAVELQPGTVQERIDFTFLITAEEDFPEAKRDLFRFGRRLPVTTEALAPRTAAPPVQTVKMPDPPVVPIDVAENSLERFTFLGFLQKAGEKTVFLSSDGNLFLAKRGERFGVDREFLVESIDGNLLRVRHGGSERLIEIPLIEQQKLRAAVSSPARMQPTNLAPGQPGTREFAPARMPLESVEAPVAEETPLEINEQNNPEPEQGFEPETRREGTEGDVNGPNQ